MPSKPFVIAANWKMNSPPAGWNAKDSPYRPRKGVETIVFPSFLDISTCVLAGIVTGGQCGHPSPQGAFTGDVGMAMLKTVGCQFVLCGHSERRTYHKETDRDVATQVNAALDAGLTPILCVGETATERAAGTSQDVVRSQITNVLSQLKTHDARFLIAYEPVWAIGTGNTATPAQAQEMHAFIRSLLPKEEQQSVRILYGGSMNDRSAAELLRQPDIDGGLVGGASLQPKAFDEIVRIAIEIASQ